MCIRLFSLSLLILLSSTIHAQQQSSNSLTVYPTAGAPLIPFTATAGVPFAPCQLTNTNDFHLFSGAVPLPLYVESTLTWPSSLCSGTASIRAVKVQFLFNPLFGTQTFSWSLSGPPVVRLPEQPICEIASTGIKAGYHEPCAYAISDPGYLVATGIIPPSTTIGADSYDTAYFPTMFNRFAAALDYRTTEADHWLFDRPSTLYMQAIRSGNRNYYREAYLAHEFAISKMEVTGRNTTVTNYCLGGWDQDGVADTFGSGGAGCDPKYIYLQYIKLHLALTGDDSWVPSENGTPASAMATRGQAFKTIADAMFTSRNRIDGGFQTPYTALNQAFTERQAGVALATMLNGYELTLDATLLPKIRTAINNLYRMQTANIDGRGNLGYLAHSWDIHENKQFIPWVGSVVNSVTNSTSIVINSTIANGPTFVREPNSLRLKTPTIGLDVAVSGAPVNNGNGTWTIRFKTPVTIPAGADVLAGKAVHGSSERVLVWNHPSDRVFSPWMQAILADALWQYYQIATDTTSRQQTEALLLGFARAITAYAVDGTRTRAATRTLIDNEFNVKIFNTTISSTTGCGLTIAPYMRYVANDSMATTAMNRKYGVYMFSSGGFADQHIPEELFQLALGLYFETDPGQRAAMQQLAQDMLEWFDRASCTAGTVNYPMRAFNWQMKPNPFGTYDWVMSL